MMFCKYCNEIMLSEHETKSNRSYFEFYVCPKCKAVYECTAKTEISGREKYEVHENARWWNPETNEWE